MNIEDMQKKIDETEYWDIKILDFQINYCGDEVALIIDNDDINSWKISFLSCQKVKYETDSDWRKITHVKDMKRPQLCYYGQDITISENKELDGFVNITMDLCIMDVELTCREIIVEKIDRSSLSLFWEK